MHREGDGRAVLNHSAIVYQLEQQLVGNPVDIFHQKVSSVALGVHLSIEDQAQFMAGTQGRLDVGGHCKGAVA